MKRYDEYIEINSPWIKNIPMNWNAKRLKSVAAYISRGETPVYTDDTSCTKVINQATFSQGYWNTKKVRYTSSSPIGNESVPKQRDVLLASTGRGVLGKVFYFDQSDTYIADSHVTIIRTCETLNSRFLYYYLSVHFDTINGLLARGSTNQTELQEYSLKNMPVPLPSADEQDQIVRYLDWQMSKINRLIAAKREKIALFEELKTHQTTDAVLHGVKQYKKYIETQEFGRIPAHWQIYQNKRLFRERVEHSKMGAETLLSVSKHYGVKPSADLTEDEQFATIKPALSLAGYKVVHKNDLVMNIMRARNGSYGISAYNGIVSPAYCIYYVTKNCNVKYLHYFLRTPHVKSLFETYSSGIAEHRRRLYPEDFLRLASVLPPIEDQNEIVEYIEQSLVKYDEAIANLKRQIACLQDMKTRLISDVVTGQIDVRGIKVPDDEYINNEITEEEFEEESENNEEE